MRITFNIPEFTRNERNSHCDVLHIAPVRVANLARPGWRDRSDPDVATKAYHDNCYHGWNLLYVGQINAFCLSVCISVTLTEPYNIYRSVVCQGDGKQYIANDRDKANALNNQFTSVFTSERYPIPVIDRFIVLQHAPSWYWHKRNN